MVTKWSRSIAVSPAFRHMGACHSITDISVWESGSTAVSPDFRPRPSGIDIVAVTWL